MGRMINLKGKRFGKWTVLEKSFDAEKRKWNWLCECDCGTVKEVDGYTLRNGLSRQCRHCITPHNRNKYTNDPIYITFKGMKQRCNDSNSKSYKDYGARGICVCDEWLNDPKIFYKWAYGNGYKEGLTIERLDNDKGYTPTNCTFIPKSEQSKNRRNNILVTINGKTEILAYWCRKYNMRPDTVKDRVQRGMSYKMALGIE